MAFKTPDKWHSRGVGAIHPAGRGMAFNAARNRLCELLVAVAVWVAEGYSCANWRGKRLDEAISAGDNDMLLPLIMLENGLAFCEVIS